jgi:hypothetical protein
VRADAAAPDGHHEGQRFDVTWDLFQVNYYVIAITLMRNLDISQFLSIIA